MVTTTSSARPGLQAQHEATLRAFPEVVDGLRVTLGARLVAYIAGVRETRAVREWAEGGPDGRKPSQAVQSRLRTAFAVTLMLRERYGASTVAAWFQGMNPQLEDRAPAWVLRTGEHDEVGPTVIAAAKSFLAYG